MKELAIVTLVFTARFLFLEPAHCVETGNTTTPKWDQHRDLIPGHQLHARSVDQPVAALLEDLEQ